MTKSGSMICLTLLKWSYSLKKETQSMKNFMPNTTEIKETPVYGITLIHKQEGIDEVKKHYDYSALDSDAVKDPLDALGI